METAEKEAEALGVDLDRSQVQLIDKDTYQNLMHSV